MDVQEKSLFELALDLIRYHKQSIVPDMPVAELERLVAEQMKAEGMTHGDYTWASWVMRFGEDKMGTPWVSVFNRPSESLMSLPGWSQYNAEKAVEAAQLVEG
ncbi:hypothetical protein [Marinobacter sp.]|uniref:hypothetical protein n=1 Tax=Marinobacter sp. TaxID=50741 RepID=UPI0035C76E46